MVSFSSSLLNRAEEKQIAGISASENWEETREMKIRTRDPGASILSTPSRPLHCQAISRSEISPRLKQVPSLQIGGLARGQRVRGDIAVVEGMGTMKDE